jgi:4-methylaminobutanoate oxidase (formaldehyde-forming)
MTKLAKYSQELYGNLEAETGVSTGFRRCGSITVALNEERKEEIYRQASMARAFGVEVEEISPKEVKEKYEYLNIDDVTAGVWLPLDGQGDPANIALALAKGARQNGGTIIQNTEVTGVVKNGRQITEVQWKQGEDIGSVEAEIVINCAGMWGHSVGKMMNTNVPLHACEHFYLVTEPVTGLTQMPVLRVPDECAYYKEDAGKFMLGAFEPNSKPW